ncbi:PadR family transcriptional regulator [Halomonas sp. THAF12]|uniref:PadR family transcriptional regulator n=1 Tax=Halomonas sp. B23F22_10 TaxID=3459515 RepID=UPI00373FB2E9
MLITLQQEPGTGYDILQRFQSGLVHVWQASHQQIYRELDRLRIEGLLRCETLPQGERPARKVYYLTEAGLEALKDWLAAPLAAGSVREPLFAKFFAWESWPVEARRQELTELQEQLRDRLATYADIEQQWFSHPESLTPAQRAPRHTLRLGQRLTTTWLAWLEEVLQDASSTQDDSTQNF